MKHGPRPSEGSSNNSMQKEQTTTPSIASNTDYRLPSTPSNIYGAVTTSPVILIYHKIEDYYGVLVDGHTVFSGSYAACVEYKECCS